MSKFEMVEQVHGKVIAVHRDHVVLIEAADDIQFLAAPRPTAKLLLTTGAVEHIYGTVGQLLDMFASGGE